MSARPIPEAMRALPSKELPATRQLFFDPISSLPVDCRSSTYEAKLRPRVNGFVSEVDHNSKSAPAASQCKLKVICVSFQFP